MFMNLARLNRAWNLDPVANLRDEINRLFDAPFAGAQETELFNTWSPAVDVYEDKENLVAQLEAPGLKKEDIEVSLHDGALTISAERREEKAAGESEEHRTERYFGRFQRTISLPKPVDSAKVKATYKDGILTVTLPKSEEAKPRQITIS
jgi:HSP20 family protein